MTTVQEIKKAIEHLPADDFSSIRDWIAERDWEHWDAQIKGDSDSGKLDFLVTEAREEGQKGNTRPL
ncbi:MAG: hypothetical protein O2923_12685 [Verrucomicrobia bacterium]|nr:hypothetical protein [Verrucomicrobiota bacterium]MDA1087974.1 hypothetical protein [Verrucomicrobiota bacterium]